MSQIAVELIVAAFEDEHEAENTLKQLEEAKKERGLGIYDTAVIRRDAGNVLHIRESADRDTGKGAVAGALIGGVIGLLFPPGILATSLIGSHGWGTGCPPKETKVFRTHALKSRSNPQTRLLCHHRGRRPRGGRRLGTSASKRAVQELSARSSPQTLPRTARADH